MNEFLFFEQHREREAELVRAAEQRRRDDAARERAARPFTSPRPARRAPRLASAWHRAA
ncbi:hypothetical protein GCM10009809_36720 [Isoptericola hypogeus]|uniref:Uncharacterized protein n=1 Tax=Isoptericola hypogeus TaxID=300179 RepID=A0ABN2JT99_9MICO